jgi:uncharacterized protein YjbI with pentapeptide repeats
MVSLIEPMPLEGGTPARKLVARSAVDVDRAAALERISRETQRLLDETGMGLDLSEQDLCGLDLSSFDLRAANLNRARLHRTVLDGACLAGASMICPGMERTSLRGANLRGAYLHALAAHSCNFDRADLSEVADFTGALFHGCSLQGATFDRSMLAGTTFYQCRLADASLVSVDAPAALFNECGLHRANFASARLDGVSMVRCQLTQASFAGAIGSDMTISRPQIADSISLESASCSGLRLIGVAAAGIVARRLSAPGLDLVDCTLITADFDGADLRHARMINSCLSQVSMRDAQLGGAMLRNVRLDDAILTALAAERLSAADCSFRRADLSGAKARSASFRDCNMEEADLRLAYLYGAALTGDPPGAMNLRRANLTGANLVHGSIAADISGGILQNAELAYAKFNQSILDGANLVGAKLPFASLLKVSMRNVVLGKLQPPFFVDRSPGFEEALTQLPPDLARTRVTHFVSALAKALSKAPRGST